MSTGAVGRDLLTMVEGAVAAPVRLHFVPSGESCSFAAVWADAGRAATWLGARLGPDAPVAMVLDSSPAALAALLGAWRAGRRVVSVPLPPRATSPRWYQAFVEDACRVADAGLLLVAGELVALLPPLAVAVAAFEDSVAGTAGGGFDERPAAGELVQFTSGSTAEPRGVVLGMGELGANVAAVLEVIDPRPGDGACSWLPLSHDMGLVGMVLASLCGSAPGLAGGSDIVLIRPDWFLRRPESWLQACSAVGATITAAPDFGFAQATRRGPVAPLDLRALRVCITGAEPVRPATLDAFAAAFAPAGFDPVAFCPAYGLAEAGLAVTLTPPAVPWSTIAVDPNALAAGEVRLAEGGRPLVSCGPPLPGYAVRIDEPAGTVAVAGPSLFRRYLPGAARTGPWLATSDLGVVHDGALHLVGRVDDVVVLAGRNVHLGDVDGHLVEAAGVRPGRVQAVAVEGGFAVVAEGPERGSAADLALVLRRAAVASVGWSPAEVVIVERGALPRTASGKPRRRETARRLVAGELPVAHRLPVR